jgi:hypothetical protein
MAKIRARIQVVNLTPTIKSCELALFTHVYVACHKPLESS